VSYALFDDAGKFLAGRVMSHTDASMQIELDSGRRVKAKVAHVLLRFEAPEPAALLERARALAADLDLELAWEFAPETDFGFAELAREYFDAGTDAVHQAAMLVGLLVSAGVVHSAVTIPHPTWMIVLGVALPPLLAWLAAMRVHLERGSAGRPLAGRAGSPAEGTTPTRNYRHGRGRKSGGVDCRDDLEAHGCMSP